MPGLVVFIRMDTLPNRQHCESKQFYAGERETCRRSVLQPLSRFVRRHRMYTMQGRVWCDISPPSPSAGAFVRQCMFPGYHLRVFGTWSHVAHAASLHRFAFLRHSCLRGPVQCTPAPLHHCRTLASPLRADQALCPSSQDLQSVVMTAAASGPVCMHPTPSSRQLHANGAKAEREPVLAQGTVTHLPMLDPRRTSQIHGSPSSMFSLDKRSCRSCPNQNHKAASTEASTLCARFQIGVTPPSRATSLECMNGVERLSACSEILASWHEHAIRHLSQSYAVLLTHIPSSLH